MLAYLVVFAVSAVGTFAATPLVRRLSLAMGWIDRPSDRKVHPKPTPTAGGLAIFLGIAAALLVSRLLPAFAGLHRASSDPDAALAAALVILGVGLLDDARGLSPLGKLAGQLLAAGLLVLLGVQLLYFYFPGQGTLFLSPDLAVSLTVLWIVGFVNAVNLIDGLDGLAAGMVAIAAVAFFLYMSRSPGIGTEPNSAALLSSVVAGAALGFLPWNFHPAKIFMGDTGAMLLGLMLAVATISGVGRNPYPPSGGDFAVIAIPVAVPLLVLAVPVVDVLLAIGRRMWRGGGLMHADKEHIHHRLLDIGHSHRQAVLLMYLWSALASACALAVAFIDGRLLVGGIVLVAVALAAALPRVVLGRTPRARDGSARVAADGAETPSRPRLEVVPPPADVPARAPDREPAAEENA